MPALARVLAVGVAVVVGASSLGGCSSSTSSTSSTPQTTAPAGPGPGSETDLAKLRACLKKQGVTLPQGPPEAGPQSGAGRPRLDADALRACAKYLPQGSPPGGAGPGGTS